MTRFNPSIKTGLLLLTLFFLVPEASAQTDTTAAKKKRSIASNAALRSAILPGFGQLYNKKYWKIPLVYGALAIPVSTYRYNKEWYEKTRFAYTVRVTSDTANFKNIAPELSPIATQSLKLYRNQFRKNMDFSLLGILLMWGLNVVDATVDGHLRTFDISDKLSMGIKPLLSPNGRQLGLTASFSFNKQKLNRSTAF